ncbi:MAG: diguanylate cyclase [Pseudomonadota bacterium]
MTRDKFLRPKNAGEHAHRVELGSAIDIFQGLTDAETPRALFDAMLALALDYNHGPDAYLVLRDGAACHVAAHAGPCDGRTPGSRLLPPVLAQALAGHDAATHAHATMVEGEELISILIALTGATGLQHGYLCLVQEEVPAPEALHTLTLIAACGATLLEKLLGDAARKAGFDARLALADHLSDERSLLRTLIDNMPDQIYVKDTNGCFVIGNKAAADCIGVAGPEDLVGKSDLELFPDECGKRFFLDEQAIMQSGDAIVDQLEENVNQAGVRRWFSTTKVPLKDAAGRVIGLVGMSRDVSLRVAADDAIRLRNRAIESSYDAIVITSCLQPDNPVVYANPAFERITGFTPDDARQLDIAALLEDADHDEAAGALRQAMRSQSEARAVLQCRRKDSGKFWNEVRLAPVRDRSGNATHLVYTMSDITKARDSEEQLERLASHDALTGLPNRRMLLDRLSQAIAMGERGHFVVAVAFIDLDRLKHVNDNFGHEAGDALLKTVADRMAHCTRKCDTVARLGGDEFVLITLHNTILAGNAPSRPAGEGGYHSYVSDMLAKVQHALSEPVTLGGEPFTITCSVGVAIYPQDGHDAETLIKHADAAMYSAKKNGRNRIKFYAGDPLP